MAIYKIRNHYSGNYLDYQTESWTTLKAIPAQQVVVASSDNSKSQRWYIDNPSVNTHIRALLDVNFGITRYENSITHQCGITNISYYNIMSNSPYDPMIKLEYSSTGYCRIKHVGSNMYLTELNYPASTPYAAWGAFASSGETMNRQLWWVETATDYQQTTFIMPQNMNQKYTVYSDDFNDAGCFCCSAGDIGAYYRGSTYTYQEMLTNNVFKENDVTCKYANIPYCDFTKLPTSSLSTIKGKIDTVDDNGKHGLSVITVEFTKPDGKTGKRRVAAYGYLNSCSTLSDLLVLDPVGLNASIDMGQYLTVQDVINDYNEENTNAHISEIYYSHKKS